MESLKHEMANMYVARITFTALGAGFLGGMAIMFPPKIIILLTLSFTAAMFLLMYRFIKLTYFFKHNFGPEPAVPLEESFKKDFWIAAKEATKLLFNPKKWRKK